jgi:predicted dehydrogenase
MNSLRPVNDLSRREFLKTSTAAVAGAAVAGGMPAVLRGASDDRELKIVLVGCGGRGTGAAVQALAADPHVRITALGDAFPEPLRQSLRSLTGSEQYAGRVKVAEEHQFVGLDAYQKVIDSGVDVVLLATPPAFRPLHLAVAVRGGKHVFCEKPMATDAPGVRSVLESARMAQEKSLCIVAGFNCRYDPAHQQFMARLHDGAVGKILTMHENRLGGPVNPMPPPSARPPAMGDLEWQLRNWYNFYWLSGDGLVEQAVHHVDRIMWAMQDQPPKSCVANGGRNVPNHEGNIYDHMDVFWEWEDGSRASIAQRQVAGCDNDATLWVQGNQGRAEFNMFGRGPVIEGPQPWRLSNVKQEGHQLEHNHLFQAIRRGEAVNDSVRMAQSTLAALIGHMAAYTGKRVTWEMALNSQEKLVPDNLSWVMKLPMAPQAVPGLTKFV